MKLYTTPGGKWAGTEKDWKAGLKAEGIDLKTYTGRRQVDVPTDKAGLMEFLTFHNVNVINPGALPGVEAAAGATPPPASPAAVTVPDVEALRAQYNPEGAGPVTTMSLDDMFEKAPIGQKLRLAVVAVDAAYAALGVPKSAA